MNDIQQHTCERFQFEDCMDVDRIDCDVYSMHQIEMEYSYRSMINRRC